MTSNKGVHVRLTSGEEGIIPRMDNADLRQLQEFCITSPAADKYPFPFHKKKEDGSIIKDSREIYLRDIRTILHD